jgi:hypothetical protein
VTGGALAPDVALLEKPLRPKAWRAGFAKSWTAGNQRPDVHAVADA